MLKKTIFPVILFLALQVPSIRVLLKFTPNQFYFFLPLFWIVAFVIYFHIYNYLIVNKIPNVRFSNYFINKILQAINSPKLAIIILLVLIVSNYFLYPIADALKYQGRGSDQDDAVIVVCKALFSGHSPYNVLTYRHNLPSPGPGLILLLWPLAITNLYALATPLFIAITAFILKLKSGTWRSSNVFLILLISTPAFWELMINGSDFLIIGCMLSFPLLLWKTNLLNWQKTGLLIFLAFALTSRVFFIFLIPFYAWFLNNGTNNIKRFTYNTLIFSILTMALHLLFYLPDTLHYSPLHLITKGSHLASLTLLIVSLISGLLLVYITIKYHTRLTNEFWLWLWIIIPITILTTAVLETRGFNILGYPLSYLALQIPLAALAFSRLEEKEK